MAQLSTWHQLSVSVSLNASAVHGPAHQAEPVLEVPHAHQGHEGESDVCMEAGLDPVQHRTELQFGLAGPERRLQLLEDPFLLQDFRSGGVLQAGENAMPAVLLEGPLAPFRVDRPASAALPFQTVSSAAVARVSLSSLSTRSRSAWFSSARLRDHAGPTNRTRSCRTASGCRPGPVEPRATSGE